MDLIFYFFVFVLGAIIGSFLNVVVLRYGTGRLIKGGRSGCFSCGKNLKWFELIPIFSFILQKGRCRNCQSKISWQYVFVEILTGLTFLFIFLKILGTPPISGLVSPEIGALVFSWIIFSILIAISVYDLRHKIIPDGLAYSFIVLSFIGSLIFGVSGSVFQIFISGLFITLPFFSLWFFSGGRWMGFGDVKLALGIGFFLGLTSGIYAILWAFWIGGAVSVTLLFLGKLSPIIQAGKSSLFLPLQKLTIKSEIPFGPFMVLGLAVAFFSNWDFLNLEIILKLF